MSNDCNVGHWNVGHWNVGNRNVGDWNVGNRNVGHRNRCSHETGFFNTSEPETIRVFDTPCTVKEWSEVEKPDCLYFPLTEWLEAKQMTDKEKEDNPDYKTTGGYLKTYDYKEAFTASMQKATPEEIEMVKALPNFNAQKFLEISGFMIKDNVTITVRGKDIEISTKDFESIKSQFLGQ